MDMTYVVITEVLMAVSGILGWCLGRFGIGGIKTQFQGIINDFQKIKTDLAAKTQS